MNRGHSARVVFGAITVALVGLVLTGCGGPSAGAPAVPAGSTAPSTTSTLASSAPTAATTPAAPAAPAETAAQKNARQKAAQYLTISAFSRDSLVDQLVQGDHFAQADAEYGVDAQHADWNAQAVAKAKQYLGISSFSHKGLVDQLVQGDRFTPSQAEAGVTGAGL